MNNALRTAAFMFLIAGVAFAADNRKELKYNLAAGGSLTIVNENGPVSVKGGPGRQVTVVATTHSDKVEVDGNQYGNRVDVRTRALQKASGNDGRVDYEITVPQDTSITVRAAGGPITVEKMRGDVMLEGDSAQVEVRDVANAHVHVRTLAGTITLRSVENGHIEVSSVNGDIRLSNVNGQKLSVNTTKGNIVYDGAVAQNGDYDFITNSGNIDVTLPASASVYLSARSVSGSVENGFPLQQTQPSVAPSSARTLVGTSNTAGSAVNLRSFSGKIRVKKQ
ncbi:MAG: DUF4097 family beta strand repeat protein [Candidatus Koribacter versatilis]|uniref:DUF4097 family beta strand repeat protein n=1 Tax=Candidatus Korobacter versatilis TaxID=658062 RepID=A0A932EQ55_9BACT|nr:DUF4097 family beta strand repeat protein [Candidatus Koribacter versatilis]